MKWGTVANCAVLLGGIFLIVWGMQDYLQPHVPEWVYYTLLLMAFAPLLWLGHQADRLVSSYLKLDDQDEQPTGPEK